MDNSQNSQMQRRDTIKKRGFKTRKEAKFAEIKFLEEHQKTPTSQIKLNDVIREYHIDAPLSLKESTLKGYKKN